MFLPVDQIGKQYVPTVYAVGREKIREYAAAVGESNPLFFDLEVARAAGYGDLLAPPMFVVVYASSAFQLALFDEDLELDFAHLVHGSQQFSWGVPVVAGDEVTTSLSVEDISERAGMRFDRFRSVSVNQRGETTCEGFWSTIVRGGE
ncbi:MAG: FAS1-like dehydratase domain-containing protein [Solirubrobacteraceae bacterium]